MNTRFKCETRPLIRFSRRAVAGVFAFMLLLPVVAHCGGVVTNCTETDLRAAMVGGGIVTFACDGTITLTNTITNETDTVLDGTGHQITISGGNAVRVFYVNSNVTFTVINLKIADGTSRKGAGIFNDGGTLNLFGASIERNNAVGADPRAYDTGEGGGVFNRAGVVNAANSSFSNNSAYQPAWELLIPQARQALGGAIRNESGLMTLQDCWFTSNSASGGAGWRAVLPDPGLDGYGGAIHNSGTLTVLRCSFLQNAASGGRGDIPFNEPPPNPLPPTAIGGAAAGGAVCNLGTLSITSSDFVSNTVAGGAGARGSRGATVPNIRPGSPGSAGGFANGGALFNQGAASVVNSTFAWNIVAGGAGGTGGVGGSALAYGSSGANGGAGGDGGSAFGGGISGGAYLTNCTLAFNSAIMGTGGGGGAGGRGVYPGIDGVPGANGINGVAGGSGITGGSCVNTLLATNTPVGNGYGSITDLGHNLSSDGSCNFSAVGSLNNTDPLLGQLANNGGPTLTMALLPGSPAIDAGDTVAAPTRDQRGFPRPAGLASDIGAFEFGSMLPVLAISGSCATGINILVNGNTNQWCRLLTSTNLSHWQCVATNQIGLNGTVLFQQSCGGGENQRFYKVAMP